MRRWVRGRNRGRRRTIAVAATLAAVTLGLGLLVISGAGGAGAVVGNPGNDAIGLSVTVLTPAQSFTNVETTSAAHATVHENGLVVIPASGITFAPLHTTIALGGSGPSDATMQLVAVGRDFAGIINPSTGVMGLHGRLEELWTTPGSLQQCPVGPFSLDLTTTRPGAARYDGRTGAATLAQEGASIDAVAPGTPGCAGLEDALNGTLGLPVTTTTTTSAPGASSSVSSSSTTTSVSTSLTDQPTSSLTDPGIAVALSFHPALRGPAPVAPGTAHASTTTHATTTTAHATTTPTAKHALATKKTVAHRRVRHHARRHRRGHARRGHPLLDKFRAAVRARLRSKAMAHATTTSGSTTTTTPRYAAPAPRLRLHRVLHKAKPRRTATLHAQPARSTGSHHSALVPVLVILLLTALTIPLLALGFGFIGPDLRPAPVVDDAGAGADDGATD